MNKTLIQQLDDKDLTEASEAAQQLATSHAVEALPALLTRLEKVSFKKRGEGYFAASLIQAITELASPRHPEVIAGLMKVLQSEAWTGLKEDAQLEDEVIAALRALRAHEAVDWLKSRFVDADWAYWAGDIATALRELSGATVAPFFVASAENEELDSDARVAACSALGELRFEDATSSLDALSADSDDDVAKAAQFALLALDPRRAHAFVTKAIAALDGTSKNAQPWKDVTSVITRVGLSDSWRPLLEKLDAVLAEKPPYGIWYERVVWRAAHAADPSLVAASLEKAWRDPERSSWTRLFAGALLLPARPEMADDVLGLARQVEEDGKSGNQGAWNYSSETVAHELTWAIQSVIKDNPGKCVGILRQLDALRRGPTALPESSALRRAAARIIHEVTGTDRYSLFDRWLAEKQDGV